MTRKDWILRGFCLTVVLTASIMVYRAGTQTQESLQLKHARNVLKSIDLAIDQYYAEYQSFPPVVVRDQRGNPVHSWRALLHSPALSEENDATQSVQYDLNKPWDSPHNLEASLAHPSSDYSYQFLAVVGPEAAWKTEGTRKRSDFQNSSGKMISLIGVKESRVSWFEPQDAVVSGETLLVKGKPLDLSRPCFVLFTDGSIEHFGSGISPETLKSMISISE